MIILKKLVKKKGGEGGGEGGLQIFDLIKCIVQ